MAVFLRRVLQQAAAVVTVRPTTMRIQQQVVRGTCVFTRMYPPNLRKKGVKRALKPREYVYVLEQDTDHKPAGNMELLLLHDVDGVGMKGEVVSVSKRLGRMQLLPPNLATYPTPEMVAKVNKEIEHLKDAPKHSIWAQKTIRQVKGMHLSVAMHPKNEWTLDKTHIKVAFRNAGVELSEECLELPEEPVTSPADITVTVTMNKSIQFEVPIRVYHHYDDARLAPDGVLPELPQRWNASKMSIASLALQRDLEKTKSLT